MNNRHSFAPKQCSQLFMISLLLCSLMSCSSSREFSDIAPGDAEEMIRQNVGNSAFVLLDVRTDGEFKSEHMDGAINLDIQSADFSDAIEKLDKAKTYLVYCRSGVRSGRAMKMMKEKGFVSVYNLQGGITKWKAENRPTEIR